MGEQLLPPLRERGGVNVRGVAGIIQEVLLQLPKNSTPRRGSLVYGQYKYKLGLCQFLSARRVPVFPGLAHIAARPSYNDLEPKIMEPYIKYGAQPLFLFTDLFELLMLLNDMQ